MAPIAQTTSAANRGPSHPCHRLGENRSIADLYTARNDGTDVERLTNGPGANAMPSWR